MELCEVCGARLTTTTKCPFCGNESLKLTNIDVSKSVINKVLESVVAIKTSFSLGTGFIIDGGFVITNAHCITYQDKRKKVYVAKTIFAEFNDNVDKNSYILNVLRFDIEEDIAILSFKNKPLDLKTISLGDSNILTMGDKVFTIGCPMGYDFSYIDGTISNPKRKVKEKQIPVIQTNMQLNNGSSGGPLCTIKGEIMGITTFNEVYISKKKGTTMEKKIDGISFAISEVAIKKMVEKMIVGGK